MFLFLGSITAAVNFFNKFSACLLLAGLNECFVKCYIPYLLRNSFISREITKVTLSDIVSGSPNLAKVSLSFVIVAAVVMLFIKKNF